MDTGPVYSHFPARHRSCPPACKQGPALAGNRESRGNAHTKQFMEGNPVETCIIRVYRNNGRQLAGLVECVEDGSRHVFHDLQALVSVLERVTGYDSTGIGHPAVASGHSAGTPRRAAR